MKKSFIIICLSLFTHLLFCQTTILMEKKDGIFLVPCKVNGLNLRFIFDTGASDVSISLTEAVFMLKNGYLKEGDFIGKKYYQIANGDIEEGTKIILKNIEIGDLIIYNVSASVIHSLSAPLLLGQSLLQKIGKFTVDYSKNILIIGEETKASTQNKKEEKKVSSLHNTKNFRVKQNNKDSVKNNSNNQITEEIINDSENGNIIIKRTVKNGNTVHVYTKKKPILRGSIVYQKDEINITETLWETETK